MGNQYEIEPEAPSSLRDLASIDDVKGLFNRDSGNTRLLLLMSPS